MTKTLEQQIADQEAKLARLKDKKRKERNNQIYTIGAAFLKAARERNQGSMNYTEAMEALLKSHIDQKDLKRMKPIADEFGVNYLV